MAEKAELEQKLGQLVYKIGKKQQVVQPILNEIQELQKQANDVATEIEKLGE